MLEMIFPLKIPSIVVILQVSLICHQAGCYPSTLFSNRGIVNFIPSDDCPENNLCENPTGYPRDFIRQVLTRNRGFYLPPENTGPVYNLSSRIPTNFEPAFENEFSPKPQVYQEPHVRVSTVPRLGAANRPSSPRPSASSSQAGEVVPDNVPLVINSKTPVLQLKEVERYNVPATNVTSPDKETRFGSDFSIPEVCPSLLRTIRPKSGTTSNNEKLFIINEDEYLTQEIDIEICGSSIEEAECKFIETSENNKAVCRQKYIIKELIALRPDGRLQSEGFKIPSYCCCDLIDLY